MFICRNTEGLHHHQKGTWSEKGWGAVAVQERKTTALDQGFLTFL